MNYSQTNNHFAVNWGGGNIGFTEVSGLSIELEVVPYHNGASPQNAATLMPGHKKFSPIVLKRGVTKSDGDFYKWINTAQLNTIERRDVTISLLNEKHEPVVTWRLINAFPFKLDYSPLNANGSGVVIESLSLAHEGLAVEYL